MFFNTHEHLKYMLSNGEVGLVKTVNKILFLAFSLANKLVTFDMNEQFEEIELDTSEIEFQNALAKGHVEEVKKLLKEKKFLGKSMVAYLLKKKYNSVALQLTQDKETAFYLSLYS